MHTVYCTVWDKIPENSYADDLSLCLFLSPPPTDGDCNGSLVRSAEGGALTIILRAGLLTGVDNWPRFGRDITAETDAYKDYREEALKMVALPR